ncbi:type IV secretory system conjugative DNA transfer family protein [Bifidobacterium vespertilionis]|nr:type IV secretory system conjugative DNA transfer family protein [Bifidobacterium vespertilionis]MBT1180318.1 type IV secretory system conjugative DNA transfer family protein [Bifidobacterium vespertilionis]
MAKAGQSTFEFCFLSEQYRFRAERSHSVSAKTIRRELMLPEELALLGTDECVYILKGVPPFRSRKLEAAGRHGCGRPDRRAFAT